MNTEKTEIQEQKSTNTDEIYEVDKLNILDPLSLDFEREKSGFMKLIYNGQTYKKVNLTRLLPFQTETEYISVSYENDEKEFREIGVIKDISELPEKQEKHVRDFLEFKYYMPEISRIYSIRDNMMGYIFIEVDCTSGRKTLCVGDWYTNFKVIRKNYLYVMDADGNKYFCGDVTKLDKKSKNLIDMFI